MSSLRMKRKKKRSLNRKNQASEVFHNLQVERQQFQARLYKKWLNSKLKQAPGQPQIEDLFQDLRDGRNLLLLLRVLTGRLLKPVKGNMRLHHLNNLTLVLDVLREHKVRLIGINNDSITDGDTTTTLGLCWNIMYHFQVVETMEHISGNAEEALLKWCENIVADYSNASVKSFQPKKWRKGYTLNAILHAFKPDLFRYSDLTNMSSVERIQHALHHAEESFDVHALFTADEFHDGSVDNKALVLYVSSLYAKMKDMELPGADQSGSEIEGLLSQLTECEVELKTLDSKEVPELYIIPDNEAVLESKHKEVASALDKVEDELAGVMKEIDNAPNLSDENKAPLLEKLTTLVQLHADIKEKWDTCKHSFLIKLNQHMGKEAALSKLSTQLGECEKQLNVLDSKEVPELYLVPENRAVMEARHKEMQDSLDQVEDELAGVIQELDDVPNLSGEDKAPLLEKLTTLAQLHADIKEKWDTCKDSFLIKLDQHAGKEMALSNLSTHLEKCEKQLQLLNNKEVPELYLLQENRAVMEAQHKEMQDSLDVIEEELSKVMQALDDPNLTDEDKAPLLDKLTVLVQLHADIKEKWDTCKHSFFVKLDHQHAKELLLMTKWKQKSKSTDETLTSLEGKLNVLLSEPITESNANKVLQEMETFESELKGTDPTINGNLDFGRTLLRSGKIVDSSTKESMQSEIDEYFERRAKMDDTLDDERRKLEKIIEAKRNSESKELQKWLEKVNQVRKTLRHYEMSGQTKINRPNSDLQVSIAEQKQLIGEASEYQVEVSNVVESGQLLMQSFTDADQNEELKSEIDSVHTLSTATIESLEEILKRLQKSYDDQIAKELLLLSKWNEKANVLNTWLDDMEHYLNNLHLANEESKELYSSRAQFESYQTRLQSESRGMQSNIDFGSSLIRSGKISDENNKSQLQVEIDDLSLRKDQLNQQFQNGNARLVAAEEQYSMNQSKLLNLWFTKANEIKKQLRAIELKGQLANGQTKDELIATLQNLEASLTSLKDLESTVTGHVDEGNALVTTTTNKVKAEELKEEIEALLSFYRAVTEQMESNHERFQKRLIEVQGEEEQLLAQWEDKKKEVDEELCLIEEQVSQFAELPEDDLLLEQAIDDNEVFSSNVANKEGELEMSVGFGRSILHSDRITNQQSKDQLQQDLQLYTSRKDQINLRIKQRKTDLHAALEDQRKRKSSLISAWVDNSVVLKQQIRDMEKEGEISNVNSKEDIESAVAKLKALIANVKDAEPSIESHLTEGKTLHSSISSGSKADEFLQELNALEHVSPLVVTSLENSLNRFVRRLHEIQGEEEQLMSQWNEKRTQIDVSLAQIEEQIENFGEIPEERTLLEAALEEQELFSSNVANKEGELEMSVGFGRSLLHSDRITNQQSKEKLQQDLQLYTSRKDQINLKIKQRKIELSAAIDAQKKREASELNGWLGLCNSLKTDMRNIQSDGREVNILNIEEVQEAMQKQQGLIKKAENMKPLIVDHSANGSRLLKTLSNPSKCDDVKEEMRSLMVQHRMLLESLKNVLESYKQSLDTMNKDDEETSQNLLIRLQLFHDWISFAKQQLQFVSANEGNESFQELIQKEQGLKKLSVDMETRATEFDQFMELFKVLSEEKEGGNISQGNMKAMEKIQELGLEWNFVIDSVDQQFKKIYDTINSIVDEKRASIHKNLSLLKKQLDAIEANEQNDTETQLSNAKTLNKICEELSKVKPLIAKLSDQTEAIGDVTLFMEDEKTVMKKSSEALQLQYVECRDQASNMKNKLQQNVLEMIKAQCEELSRNTRAVEERSQPFDSVDLTSLAAVKNFLHQEQKIIEEIKVEHFKVDDIETFAEQVSAQNVLSPDDQVALANIINDALKTVEDAQKKSKSKINKVYAVCYHTLNQNYQALMSRLSDVEKESIELDDSVIQDYPHLKNDYAAMKGLRTDLDSVKTDELQVHEDIQSIKDVLDPSDEKKLESLQTSFTEASEKSDQQLAATHQRLISKAGAISEKKLDEFLGWYPIMKKRSEERSELGPDVIAIERQLQEVKVIEQQANYHSFNLLFNDDEGKAILQELDPNQQKEIQSAHADWIPIKEWLTKRKTELENARNIWEEFISNSTDLVDYLNHTERETNTWNELDLNDDESVEEQKTLLKQLLDSMETRKSHMTKLNDVLGELLDLIGVESQMSTKLRSQVADTFAMWNRLIIRNIENSTKLSRVHNKFKELLSFIQELREWINSTVEVLRVLSTDDGVIEDSMKKVEGKKLEFNDNKKKLSHVIMISDELSTDADTTGHYTINDDVQLLERDFQGVETELERLDSLFSKAHLFFRRTRFSIRKKIDDIRTPNDEKTTTNASVESKVDTDLESKVDIELQDNGKDNLVGEQTAEITVK
ncbi:utrophin-like isoform X2 [Clytia hemisphaerica]|uniref:utrophin-like isoform X2 n=1 Tax=Clytia hemisphaerica TaxID=252671 RepID=UPI0034D7818C